MKKIRNTVAILSAALLILLGCASISSANIQAPASNDVPGETSVDAAQENHGEQLSDGTAETMALQEMSETPDSEVQEFEEYDLHLMAVGDNLLHMGIVYTGKQADGSFDYSFLFEGIAEFLETADIKMINQETPLAGNQLGFSGYPRFNSPTEVGDAIADAGFNVVLQATNHTADQGISGIDSCVAFWENHPDVLLCGIHEPADENTKLPLLNVGDVTFAVLNYTYGPNYGSASKELAGRMDILCAVNEQSRTIDFTTLNPRVTADIQAAKEIADIVIVCPHWGNEYQTTPSSYQESFAMQMTEAGADVIIGTHPHVVQPVRLIESENGNTALCYYSLGNYVSTQKNGKSMLEAMAWITFHVSEQGVSLSADESGAIPLVCHYSSGPVRLKKVYLLEDYTQELARQHGIIPYGGISFNLSDLETWSGEILGDRALTAEQVLPDAVLNQ